MKHRQCVAGIYCLVTGYIAAVLPSSAALTTLLVPRKYRRNSKYSRLLSSAHKNTCCQRRWELCAMKDDNEDSILKNSTTVRQEVSEYNIGNTKTEFDWDTFLDTPFFDPNIILKDPNSNSLLKRFASWVQEDYETVEIIATATLFIFLIVVSQELLRVQIYGFENYIPFTKGILPGSLF